jgi:hypothetical protein
MSGRDDLRAAREARATRNGGGPAEYVVTFDAKGKMILPPVPAVEDVAGHCAWLTCVFALVGEHPITGGRRDGQRGPLGHVALQRAGAPGIRFEPATRINAPAKLIEDLSWQLLPVDGAVRALDGGHCRQISYVVRMLCHTTEQADDAQETAGILGTFAQGATLVEGHTTYGGTSQRFEAAIALRREVDDRTGRPMGAARYLIDENTGELVIAAGDLQDAARRHVGSSLPRGWLDARVDALGWMRVRLDGRKQPGRRGLAGPHARIDVYRGHLPAIGGDGDD